MELEASEKSLLLEVQHIPSALIGAGRLTGEYSSSKGSRTEKQRSYGNVSKLCILLRQDDLLDMHDLMHACLWWGNGRGCGRS